MTFITDAPIDVTDLISSVGRPTCGGLATFLGIVRAGPEDGPVVSIDYSAYPEMVETEWQRIADEAIAKWPDSIVGGRHRVGTIAVGEVSLAVAVASPHRAESFDVCRFVVEEIKRRLPIWKKEHFADGKTAWRDNVTERSAHGP